MMDGMGRVERVTPGAEAHVPDPEGDERQVAHQLVEEEGAHERNVGDTQVRCHFALSPILQAL
jgi:hypothetical protein